MERNHVQCGRGHSGIDPAPCVVSRHGGRVSRVFFGKLGTCRIEQAHHDVFHEGDIRFDHDDRRGLLHETRELTDRAGGMRLRVEALQQAMAKGAANRVDQQNGNERLRDGQIATGLHLCV